MPTPPAGNPLPCYAATFDNDDKAELAPLNEERGAVQCREGTVIGPQRQRGRDEGDV